MMKRIQVQLPSPKSRLIHMVQSSFLKTMIYVNPAGRFPQPSGVSVKAADLPGGSAARSRAFRSGRPSPEGRAFLPGRPGRNAGEKS